MNGNRCTVALPCYNPVIKSAPKPKNPFYPKELKTFGDHIRQKRLDLKLEQKDVAKMIQVTTSCIWNWENHWTRPMVRYYPAIIDFLGYCPWEHPKNWGGRLNLYRVYQGLSFKKFAQIIGVDPGALARQMKKKRPSIYFQRKVAEFEMKYF